MNRPAAGWALAGAAVLVGYWVHGWPGVVLAVTLTAFWLLLQFSRALRVMRRAGSAPLGQVDSAVMLNAKLRAGMTMLEVLPVAGSLGEAIADAPRDTYRWSDGGGASVRVSFVNGRLQAWQLTRPGDQPQ
ncbi:hypothetical protein [Methylibium sp.]|uniref:hypothetical protein n=1 Tax=Methylibium sp. TaxID=2067992 RepID=UPI003D0FCB3B